MMKSARYHTDKKAQFATLKAQFDKCEQLSRSLFQQRNSFVSTTELCFVQTSTYLTKTRCYSTMDEI
jgi:hypothetical protein